MPAAYFFKIVTLLKVFFQKSQEMLQIFLIPITMQYKYLPFSLLLAHFATHVTILVISRFTKNFL